MMIYNVTVPIAGHVTIKVEAESEEEAIEQALDSTVSEDNEIQWELLERFNDGNICYCPQPWEAEAEEIGEVEGDEAA